MMLTARACAGAVLGASVALGAKYTSKNGAVKVESVLATFPLTSGSADYDVKLTANPGVPYSMYSSAWYPVCSQGGTNTGTDDSAGEGNKSAELFCTKLGFQGGYQVLDSAGHQLAVEDLPDPGYGLMMGACETTDSSWPCAQATGGGTGRRSCQYGKPEPAGGRDGFTRCTACFTTNFQCTGPTPGASVATASGDPHLTNIHGKKFDIHDGKHRLVHYPQGAPDSEALLMIDADAAMMHGETSCYNVFFQSARLSGKWVGDDILLQHDNNTMGKKTFTMGLRGQHHAWSALAQDAASLKFSGLEPINMITRIRREEKDLPGGDDVQFSIGARNPVLVDVWSSQGSNELTDGKDIQYLNIQVKNLPRNSGGLLGADIYARPEASKCGLTSKEMGPITSLEDLSNA